MMNLDVSVRLLDGLTKPAGEADRAIARIGKTAERVATRVRSLATASRGLAGAVRELRAADTASDRATGSGERLRGAMAGIGPAARTAGAGLGIAARAAERVAASANKAADATARLHGALGAAAPATGFVASANTAMTALLSSQRQAIANMRALNAGSGGRGGSGSGNGGRRGMGGAPGGGLALAYDAPGIGAVARKAIEVSITAEDAILRARLNGFTEDQIDKIKTTAAKVANDNRSTTYAGNVKGLIEARLALAGDLDRAVKLFPKAADFGVIFAKVSGETDKAEAATKAIYAAFRGGELRNIVGDENRLDSLFRGMMASSIVSEGKIGPQQFASNIQYARSAGLALSDSFTNFTLPFLMQELQNAGKGSRGGQAGNALMSGYSAVVQGRIAHGQEWVDAGELDASDLDKRGKLKPGAHPKDMALYMSDPLAFFQKLMKNFEGRGITSQNDKLAHISAMFDNRVAAGLADLLSLQDSRIESARAMYMQAGGDTPGSEQQKLALINATLGQSTENLNNAFTDLRVTAMAPFMGMMTGATQTTNAALKTTQGLLSRFTGIGSDPNDPKSTGTNVAGIALSAGSLAFLAAKFLAKFPNVSTVIGQVGVGAATQSPIAGFLSKSIVKSMVDGINTGLASVRGAGILRSLGRGLWMGMLEQAGEWGIGKMVDLLPKKDLGARQGAFDDNRREWDRAPIWSKPGLIWKDIFGGRAGDEPAPGTISPYGGARARGGPVMPGASYLVGENGPEIFTPGQAGGIATNRATRGLMSSMGDDATPRSIRYLSFALTSAIDGVARAIDRGNRRNSIGDSEGDGGNGMYDSGTGAGAGSGHRSFGGGGRRGFMEHGDGAPPARGRRGLMEALTPAGRGGDIPTDGDSVKTATALLKKREGFQGTAKWDRNHLRLGYGSDTITDKDGKVREVMAGDHVDREGAERDLARRIPEFQRKVAREVGVDNWNKLSPAVQGALTSTAYNYGGFSKRSTFRAAIATGDNSKIAAAVRAMKGDNRGVNSARREEEAGIIETGGVRKAPSASIGPQDMGHGGDIMGRLQDARRRGLITNEQCVSLATASVGLHPGMAGNNVHEWRRGESAADGTLKPGTPIATFLDRQARQSGRYAGGGSGTMGAHLDHAGVLESYIRDRTGKAIGMNLAEQYKGSGGIHSKAYMFGSGRFGEHNGSNYSAIKGPDGAYLGGANNPMNRDDRVPEVLREQAKARAADRDREARNMATGGDTNNHFHGDVNIPVHAHPTHDARQIASTVHEHFKRAVDTQLNDGAFA